jgi:hypothetical protein
VLCISKNRDRASLAALATTGDAQTLSAFLMAWSLLNLMNFGKKMFNPSFFNLISLKSVL